MQLLLEITVTHLLQDIGIARLIDLKCLVAMRADDFMHDYFH
ncbi:hypothetical protein ACWGNA_08770 [Brucella cytisi]